MTKICGAYISILAFIRPINQTRESTKNITNKILICGSMPITARVKTIGTTHRDKKERRNDRRGLELAARE